MILLILVLELTSAVKKYNWCCKVTAKKQPIFDLDRNLELPSRSLISKAKKYWEEMDVDLREIQKLRNQGPLLGNLGRNTFNQKSNFTSN